MKLRSILVLGALCLLQAQPNARNAPANTKADEGPPVFYLSNRPAAEDLRQAHLALDQGDIVATGLPDAARFAATFNFSLGGSQSRHRPKPPCLMAVRKTASGQLRTFIGRNTGWRSEDTPGCERSFRAWRRGLSNLEAAPLPGWTFVKSITPQSQVSPIGNAVYIDALVYRANAIDPSYDYYLVRLLAGANPLSGWTTSIFAMQSGATANVAGVAGADLNFLEYGPHEDATAFSLGASLPYSNGDIGTFSEDGLQSRSLLPYPTPGVLEWVFYNGLLNNAADAASIIPVPAGTSTFTLNLYAYGGFQNSSLPADIITSLPFDTVTAPFLSVPSDVYVTPGGTGTINVKTSAGITWQLTARPDFADNIDSDSSHITFDVAANAAVGTTAAFSVDTVPPAAVSQVAAKALTSTVHVVSQLPKSGVLLAGGVDWNGNTLQTAQVWDPATGFPQATNYLMQQPRSSHTATVILGTAPNAGMVLLAGGFTNSQPGSATATTELFDPATGQFTPGPPMSHAHASHCAVRMNNGKILIIGGVDATGATTAVVDVFNPILNKFEAPLHLLTARESFSAVVLQDGAVLVTGGTPNSGDIYSLASAELYDPANGDLAFGSVATNMQDARQGHSSVLLDNGQALTVGGWTALQSNGPVSDPWGTAEFYTFGSTQPFALTSGSNLAPGRKYAAVVHIPGDSQTKEGVFVIGGDNLSAGVSQFELSTQSFTNVASLLEQRQTPQAVAVLSGASAGSILTSGGVYYGTGNSQGTLLELYDPRTGYVWSGGTMNSARTAHTATWFGLGTLSLPAGPDQVQSSQRSSAPRS